MYILYITAMLNIVFLFSAAKIPVGLMSGYLLETYIDEDKCDADRAKIMWLIIGISTISSPILITIFDRCLREPLENQNKSKKSGPVVTAEGREEEEAEGEFLNNKK